MKRREEKIGVAENQKDRERVEARGVFALERVGSCGSGDCRWRTELEFDSSEPFDDSHRSAAFGTAPRWRGILGAGSMWLGLCLWCRVEQVKAKWQERGAFAIGQKAEMPDAHEAFRKDVQ